MLFLVNLVNNTSGNNYFRIIGEHASAFPSGSHVQIRNSTGNNGIYKVNTATNVTGYTHLTVAQPIPSGIADGQLNGGVYQLDFSDATITGKTPIILAPTVIDETSTSITLPARGAWDYGERLVENSIHVLENFASNTAPAHPTIGQHWFDYSTLTMKTWIDGAWSSTVNIENGILSFKDPQNATANSKVFVTAAEPAGKTATGLTIYPEHDVAANSPILRVLSSAGNVHLSVERSNAIRTDLRFIADSAATSEFKGKVSIGTPTNSYSTGSSTNIKGHVDLSGKLIIDESAAQHGVYGLVSGASLRTVSGLWTLTSTNADAAVLNSSDGEIARFGGVIRLRRNTEVTGNLEVSGVSALMNTDVNGTLTALTVNATTALNTPSLSVPSALTVTTAAGATLLKDLNASTFKVINLGAPVATTDAANKKYVDDNDYLNLMGDVTITSPLDKQVLYYNNGTSKWVNATLDTSYISGFGGNVKDQAAQMIADGTHVGLTPTYNSTIKAMSFAMNTRPLSVSGDVSGTANIDWTGTTNLALALPSTGIGAGTYTKITFDAKGRGVTGGTLAATDIPNLDWAKITTGKPTTATGYGIVLVASDIPNLDAAKITTGTLTVGTSGNAATATKLATARTINGVAFDGTANITVVDSAALAKAGGTVTGVTTFSNTTASTSSTTGAVVITGGLGVGGSITCAGDVTGFSDERLKTNITVIKNALAKVRTLDGVVFDRVDTKVRQAGLIAQQLERVLPEAVGTSGEYLTVAYGNVTGLLVESIKDLANQVDALKKQLESK